MYVLNFAGLCPRSCQSHQARVTVQPWGCVGTSLIRPSSRAFQPDTVGLGMFLCRDVSRAVDVVYERVDVCESDLALPNGIAAFCFCGAACSLCVGRTQDKPLLSSICLLCECSA